MSAQEGLKIETIIKLNKFLPRKYQLPLFDAFENKGYKRILAIWPRRAGKDFCAFQIMIRAALRKPAVYYMIYPTYSQGRKILWDTVINSTGMKFIDFIPSELIAKINSQEMKITLKNGSLLQILGSDNYNSLVGTSPTGAVFSEYALQDERCYQYLRPAIAANDGWSIFISTPRGHNHLWGLYNIALNSPDWFCYKIGLDETQHIPLEEIERDRANGTMSEDLIQQEYYCSFSLGVEGSFYQKYIDKMKISGQIGVVPWEAGFKVHTAWDIGMRDDTCIVFFQVIGQTVRVIDCYSRSKEGLEHYINVVNSKPYAYGKHVAPHDIKVREFSSGMTRIEKARQLGIEFTIASNISIADGIESVRSAFSKIWIDEVKCKDLIKALENYRQEYDHKHKVYKSQPLHNWASHFSDCFRYLCISLPRMSDGMSAEELERKFQEARYGNEANLPRFFRN